MYLPRHFAVSDLAHIQAFVDAAGAADLVTFDGTRPVATLLPVIWDRPAPVPDAPGGAAGPNGAAGEPGEAAGEPSEAAGEPSVIAGSGGTGGLGRLLGHVALANDQWRTARPDAQALAIVHGPQAYISPSWYESKTRHGRVVPTWNYETVHLTGTLTVHRDPEWLRDIVTRLTRRHEGAKPRPWAVTDAPPAFIDGQLRAIVGVELTILSVEAKQKLSQNRSAADQQGAIAGLRAEPGPGPAAIAAHMAENLARHPAPS